MQRIFAAAFAFAVLIAAPAGAQNTVTGPYLQVEELPMVSPSADILGRPLTYPEGKPVIRTFRITVPPGAEKKWHLHEVPLFGYIVSGALQVDYGPKGKKTFKAGTALLEAVQWCHASHAVGDEPAVLIVTYLGNETLKNTAACPK